MNISGIDNPTIIGTFICAGDHCEIVPWLDSAFDRDDADDVDTDIDWNPQNTHKVAINRDNYNKRTINECIKCISNFYLFSNWYKFVSNYTQRSTICEVGDLFTNKIDEIIAREYPYGAFVRLDAASSKSIVCHSTAATIIPDLLLSDRTAPTIRQAINGDVNALESKLIIRNFMPDIAEMFEFRCFIFDKTLRGITSGQDFGNVLHKTEFMQKIAQFKSVIQKYTAKIARLCEYDDCTIDIAINRDNLAHFAIHGHDLALELIEINSPVWLLATSGLFDLEIPADCEVLFGKWNPTIISYPVVKLYLGSVRTF